MWGKVNKLNFLFIFALSVFAVSFVGYLMNEPDPDVLDANQNVSYPHNEYYAPVQSLQFGTDNAGGDTISLPANPGPANNGGATNYAIFFNLIAGSNDIIVTQISSANTAAAGGNFTVEVLVRDGNALGGPVGSGPGSSMAGWTSLDTVPATQGPTSSGISLLFTIPKITVPAGDTVGVALRFFGAGPRYFGTGTPPYSIYADTNISLVTGDSRSTPFLPSGSFFSSRALTGEIRYVVVAPPPPTSETLVLLHDSTLGTAGNIAERKADRDTLLSTLPMLISDYDVMTFDTTTSLSSLSGYKTIIVQETSFDDAIVRYLGQTARGQLKTWLNSGTPGNKKALLMINADNGYNYSRSGSGGRDLELSQTLLKYVYQADNSGSLAPFDITGVDIDNGNTRSYTNTTSGFWPDGVSVEAGGDELYRYSARGADDSLAGVGYNGTGYVSATLNLDPRYFTGSFKATLEKYIGYLVTNGGVITGVQNISNNVVDRYSLAQNYPNPFNPTTKIKFALPKAGLVSLKVYDMLGREVQTLVNQQLNAGEFSTDFDGSNLSSGTYFYRLQVGDFVEIKKMVLLK